MGQVDISKSNMDTLKVYFLVKPTSHKRIQIGGVLLNSPIFQIEK
jgi:hypothetical protein